MALCYPIFVLTNGVYCCRPWLCSWYWCFWPQAPPRRTRLETMQGQACACLYAAHSWPYGPKVLCNSVADPADVPLYVRTCVGRCRSHKRGQMPTVEAWLEEQNRMRLARRRASGIKPRAPKGSFDRISFKQAWNAERQRARAEAKAADQKAKQAAIRRQNLVGRVRLRGKGLPPALGPLPRPPTTPSISTGPPPCTPPCTRSSDAVTRPPDPVTPELFALMDARMLEYDKLKREPRPHFLLDDRCRVNAQPRLTAAKRAALFGSVPPWLR